MADKKDIFNNVIYYDESSNLNTEEKDIDLFEEKTNGAFLLCTDIDSLKFVMEEIKQINNFNEKKLFNLIVKGNNFEKVIEFLKKNSYMEHITKTCIYAMNKNENLPLKEKYKDILEEIYTSTDEIISFIEKNSSPDIEPYISIKLITFSKYQKNYFGRHKNLAEYYGINIAENFNELFEKLKLLINKNVKESDKKKVEEKFKKFENTINEKDLNKKLIKEYLSGEEFMNLNRWLMSLNEDYYDYFSYFAARLMFAMNSYAIDNNIYYKEKKVLYRGLLVNYSSLLFYEKAKGKVILYPNFLSTTEIEQNANMFSRRENSKENYEKNKRFSVLFHIENNFQEGWIPSGINAQNLSPFPAEKEIIYLPFSFFHLDDVKIDKNNYTADIYMTTVGKLEILENKIKTINNGENIVYDAGLNVITIKN